MEKLASAAYGGPRACVQRTTFAANRGPFPLPNGPADTPVRLAAPEVTTPLMKKNVVFAFGVSVYTGCPDPSLLHGQNAVRFTVDDFCLY